MALPAIINSGLSWSDHKNNRLGPFENTSTGHIYVVLFDKINSHLEVWRSTDNGDTWSEQDSANHPSIPTSLTYRVADVVQVSTTLHIATLNTSNAIIVRTFSLSTNTWGTSTAAGPVIDQSSNVDSHISSTAALFLAVRSDGDYIVLHQGDAEAIMGTSYRRVVYSRHEGSTWTSDVAVSATGVQTHYDARGILMGSSDRAHLIYAQTSGTANLIQNSLTSTNTLISPNAPDSTTVSSGAYGLGVPIMNGTQLIVPYIDSTNEFAIAKATSADTPVWSLQDISATTTTNPETANSNPGAVVVVGSTVHAFWVDANLETLWKDNDAGTGTWGTDTRFYTNIGNGTFTLPYQSWEGDGGTTEGRGQSFLTPAAGLTLSSVYFRIAKAGTPTDGVVVDVVLSVNGTLVATSDVVPESSITAGGSWIQFTFSSPPSLSGSIPHDLRLRRTGATDTTNRYFVATTVGSVYPDGTAKIKSGGTWSNGTNDTAFGVNAIPNLIEGINATALTSAIGLLYSDEGTVKYDAVSTSSALSRALATSFALSATNKRTITTSFTPTTTDKRTVTSTFATGTTQKRVVPTTAALSTTLTRALSTTFALTATERRTVSTEFVATTTQKRTISTTFAVSADITAQRQITTMFSLLATAVRAVSTSYALQQTTFRNILSIYSVQATDKRTLTSTFALILDVGVRTIPTEFVLQQTNKNIISSSFSLEEILKRALSSNFALRTTNVRQALDTFALVTTQARNASTTYALVLDSPIRTVPTIFTLQTTNSRSVQSEFSVNITDNRSVPTTFSSGVFGLRPVSTMFVLQTFNTKEIVSRFALQTQNQKIISTSFTTNTTLVRTISTQFVINQTNTTAIPTLYVIRTTNTNAFLTSFTLYNTFTNNVPNEFVITTTKYRALQSWYALSLQGAIEPAPSILRAMVENPIAVLTTSPDTLEIFYNMREPEIDGVHEAINIPISIDTAEIDIPIDILLGVLGIPIAVLREAKEEPLAVLRKVIEDI